jgi:hypothetical protein
MSEYGETKSLQEILEELAVHCQMVSLGTPTIKVILPRAVIDNFSSTFCAKQRFIPTNEAPANGIPEKSLVIKSLVLSAGRVELFNDEDNEVTIKETI